jgi:hypothetical protein
MMHPDDFKKTNHFAVAGFILPFLAAGVAGVLVLIWREGVESLGFLGLFLTVVPLIMMAGLISSLKSIPLIEEKGDKDYAYSGLTMNILFLSVYVLSLIYFFLAPSN